MQVPIMQVPLSASNLKHPLRTNHIPRPNLPLPPSSTSNPNRNSQRLKRTLSPVVVIIAIRTPNMQRHARGLRKALQPMRDHLRAQVADLLAPEPDVDDRPRPAGEVEHRPREGFVEGRVAAPEPCEGFARA